MVKKLKKENYPAFLARVTRTGYLDHPDPEELAAWIADDKRRKEIFCAREAFLATMPETPNVEVEPRRPPQNRAPTDGEDDPFQSYLAAIRRGHLHLPGVSMRNIQAWERDPNRQ